jgi:hypothetical protein
VAGFSELFGGGRAVAVAAKPTLNPTIANMRPFLFIAKIKMQWRDFRSCRESDWGRFFFGGTFKKRPQRCAGRGLVGHASFHVPEKGRPPARFQKHAILKNVPSLRWRWRRRST